MGFARSLRWTLAAVCFAASGWGALAQSGEQQRLNALCADQVQWRVDPPGILTIDVFTDGRRYRRDVVALSGLAPDGIAYVEAEGGFVLTAIPGERPIAQEVFKYSTVRRTGRSVVPCTLGAAEASEAVDLLRRQLPGSSAQDVTRRE